MKKYHRETPHFPEVVKQQQQQQQLEKNIKYSLKNVKNNESGKSFDEDTSKNILKCTVNYKLSKAF